MAFLLFCGGPKDKGESPRLMDSLSLSYFAEVALCNQDEEFVKILPGIDASRWSWRWNTAYLGQPSWFISFTESLRIDLPGRYLGPGWRPIILS